MICTRRWQYPLLGNQITPIHPLVLCLSTFHRLLYCYLWWLPWQLFLKQKKFCKVYVHSYLASNQATIDEANSYFFVVKQLIACLAVAIFETIYNLFIKNSPAEVLTTNGASTSDLYEGSNPSKIRLLKTYQA